MTKTDTGSFDVADNFGHREIAAKGGIPDYTIGGAKFAANTVHRSVDYKPAFEPMAGVTHYSVSATWEPAVSLLPSGPSDFAIVDAAGRRASVKYADALERLAE